MLAASWLARIAVSRQRRRRHCGEQLRCIACGEPRERFVVFVLRQIK
jgi:hypothetical protein